MLSTSPNFMIPRIPARLVSLPHNDAIKQPKQPNAGVPNATVQYGTARYRIPQSTMMQAAHLQHVQVIGMSLVCFVQQLQHWYQQRFGVTPNQHILLKALTAVQQCVQQQC